MKVTSLESLSIQSVKLNEGLGDDDKLVVNINAIHNATTRNLTNYTEQALKGSISMWTNPYEKKVLKNHDLHAEPLGRILAAQYGYDDRTKKNCVVLTAEINDKDAIQKIKDKRYSTVSVGGSSDVVKCSVCGQNIAEDGPCEHYKGEYYDGNMCYWIIESFEPDEVSFVNAPADIFAGVSEIVENDPFKPQGTVFNNSSEAVLPPNVGDRPRDDNGSPDDGPAPNQEADDGKDNKPIDHMDTSTQGKTNFAHRLLHMWWNNPSKTNWTKDEIKKEHTKVVRAMFNKYHMKHNLKDGLDDTLPADLKKRSGDGK